MTPDWFSNAIASPPVLRSITASLGGATVRTAYRSWGTAGAPLVVLVHGGAAHAGWWDHLAPSLADHHRVVAVDLAGHGDSEWLPTYTMDRWQRQVGEVVRHESPAAPVVLVGHSMGGLVVALAAQYLAGHVAGVMLVDTQVLSEHDDPPRPGWTAPGARRVVADRQQLVSRFRTLPADQEHLPFVEQHIADLSVTEVDGGWSWKFDPSFTLHDRVCRERLAPLTHAQVAVVRGERGLVSEELGARTARALGWPHHPVTIQGSGHHVQLDQPVALTALIALAAGTWLTGSRSAHLSFAHQGV